MGLFPFPPDRGDFSSEFCGDVSSRFRLLAVIITIQHLNNHCQTPSLPHGGIMTSRGEVSARKNTGGMFPGSEKFKSYNINPKSRVSGIGLGLFVTIFRQPECTAEFPCKTSLVVPSHIPDDGLGIFLN